MNQPCLKIKGDPNALTATGGDFEGAAPYGYDATTTTQYALKTAKLLYDLTAFTTTNASCNAILKSGGVNLKGYGIEKLVRSWLTTITIYNYNKSKMSVPGKADLEELQRQICEAVNELEPTTLSTKAQCIKDGFGDDDVKYELAKKECNDKKDDGENVAWSDSKCKCYDTSSAPAPVIVWTDGCIDPKAFNYYCKKHPSKCGTDNTTLPENMVPTQCDYSVEETLKYTYYLSKLDNPDPEDSINVWSGDITITGTSSFDSPDDSSWLTRSYNPWKGYWVEKCSKIGDANIHFDSDFEGGLYDNLNDEIVIPDLINALLKYTSDFGNHKFLKNYKIMIMDDGGVNLGVVGLHENRLTLNVVGSNGKELQGLLSYRISKNNGSKVSSTNYPDASTDEFNKYFQSKKRKLGLNVSVDDNYIINVEEPTNESIIGLGTLLERKDKPIIGLGSLLED